MGVQLPGLYQVFFDSLGASGTSLLWAMAASVLLGAVHAFSPGHGKTLIVASLMGSRGSARRALALASTVAVTHTASVLVVALIVVVADASLLPQELTPVITLAAAVLTVGFGLDLTRRAVAARSPGHAHPHDHGAHVAHRHPHPMPAVDDGSRAPGQPGPGLSWRYTVSVGLVGGLVPNATALVVVVMAGSFGQAWAGVLLVACYGAGIASVLAAIGVGSVVIMRRGGGAQPGAAIQRLVAALPLASGLVVVAVGVVLGVQAAIALRAPGG